jgi:MFS family permease
LADQAALQALSRVATAEPPVVRLWLNGFFGYTAIGASIQVMPDFVHAKFGGGAFEAGLAVTIGFLATMLARPIAGRVADWGNPRRVIIAGSSLAAFGALAHLLSANLATLIAARLLLGLGEGTLFTASIGWVLASVTPERRGAISGRFGLSMWGGLSCGPLLGAALQPGLGFNAVWILACGLPVCGLLLLLSTTSMRSLPTSAAPQPTLLPRAAWAPSSSYVFASIGYGVIASSLEARLTELAIPFRGMALAIFGASFLTTRLFGSHLVDRHGVDNILISALLIEAVGLAGLSFATSSATCFIFDVTTAAGLALVYPCYVAWVAERAKSDERITALGVVISAWDLGVAIGGPLAGLLSRDAYVWAFCAAAAASLIALVAFLFGRRP